MLLHWVDHISYYHLLIKESCLAKWLAFGFSCIIIQTADYEIFTKVQMLAPSSSTEDTKNIPDHLWRSLTKVIFIKGYPIFISVSVLSKKDPQPRNAQIAPLLIDSGLIISSEMASLANLHLITSTCFHPWSRSAFPSLVFHQILVTFTLHPVLVIPTSSFHTFPAGGISQAARPFKPRWCLLYLDACCPFCLFK